MAILHKPIREGGAGVRTNQKAAARDSSQQRATMSGTLSTSASSLGSELVDESIRDSSRNPVWEGRDQGRDQRRTDGSLDRSSFNRDQNQRAGKTDAAAAKSRDPKRVRKGVFTESSSTLISVCTFNTL